MKILLWVCKGLVKILVLPIALTYNSVFILLLKYENRKNSQRIT